MQTPSSDRGCQLQANYFWSNTGVDVLYILRGEPQFIWCCICLHTVKLGYIVVYHISHHICSCAHFCQVLHKRGICCWHWMHAWMWYHSDSSHTGKHAAVSIFKGCTHVEREKKVKTAKMAKGRQTVSGRVQGLCYRLLNVTVTFYYSGTCNQNIFTNLSLCVCLFSLSQRCRQKLTKVHHERHHAVAVMVSVINSNSLDSSAACQF